MKKGVRIYQLDEEGSQTAIATCVLHETGDVVCSGDENIAAYLNDGIRDFGTGKALYPKDGLRFLQNLKNNFTNGYLNASDVSDFEL